MIGMKKGKAIALVMTAILAVSSAAYAATSEAKAKELMYQYCEEQLGYSKEALEPYNFMRTEEGGWVFSLKVKDADPTTNGLVIGEIAEDGQLVALEGPKPIPIHEQLREALLRSERSYEAMYRLKLEWEPRLSQLSAEDLAEFDANSSNWPLIALINHDIRLPTDNDISYEEARKSAEEAILALPGWTQEMLDHIAVRFEVYHVPVNSSRPVYQFIYSLESFVGHLEEVHSGQSDTFNYDELRNEERRVFGKALPYVVNVRIDAQTGKAVGDIYIEVPPVSNGHAIKFVLCE